MLGRVALRSRDLTASTLLVVDPEFADPYLASCQHETNALRLHARYPVQPHSVKMMVGQD